MLDEELKKHRKELELAINEALTESPEITRAIQKIRETGFDVFLIIEATIGFNRRDGAEAIPSTSVPTVRMELTSQDERFLRSLKISPQ